MVVVVVVGVDEEEEGDVVADVVEVSNRVTAEVMAVVNGVLIRTLLTAVMLATGWTRMLLMLVTDMADKETAFNRIE